MYRRLPHALWNTAMRTASTTKHKELTDTSARIYPPIQNKDKEKVKMEQLQAMFLKKAKDKNEHPSTQAPQSFKKS